MTKTILALAALLLSFALTSATNTRDTCLGNFSANMQIGQGEGSATMKFDGKLAWAKPNLRLDLKDKTTKEATVLLVDFKGGDATLLYPDTLNGIKTKLPAVDTAGYITQFQNLLTTGGKQMEKGWKKSKVGADKIGNTAATKYKLTGPKGEEVLWWVDGKERPLKLRTSKGGMQLALFFGEMNFGASVPAKTFTYSKDYSVLEMSPEAAKQSLPVR